MELLGRLLALLLAVGASTALQVAAEAAETQHCDDEGGEDCTDCAADCLCICCPLRVTSPASPTAVFGTQVPTPVRVTTVAHEPVLGFVPSDIFQPPRA